MSAPNGADAREDAADAFETAADAADAPAAPDAPGSARAPAPPSIHVRAVLTWLAIFPLVAITSMASEPLIGTWHPIARACVVTLVVVPLAVYLVVPSLVKLYGRIRRR